jgi:hypothetical protein
MSRLSLIERLRRMNQRSLFTPVSQPDSTTSTTPGADAENPPAGEARAEAIQRLQVGLFGIGAMVLLVGLASIIGSQADQADEAAVPEAAPTTEPVAPSEGANPLADAGVVPDIAAEPTPSPTAGPTGQAPAGNAAPAQ